MYAIEFGTDIQDDVVKIPSKYSLLRNAHARVVVMLEESTTDGELKALSEHSANAIVEWHDAVEDQVWT